MRRTPISRVKQGMQQFSARQRFRDNGSTDQKMELFLKKVIPESAADILTFLNLNTKIYSLAHIPININVIVDLWRKGEIMSDVRTITELYNKIVKELLKSDFDVIGKHLEKLAFEGVSADQNKIILEPGADLSKFLDSGLIEVKDGLVSFVDLSFQEYFAAGYIARGLEAKVGDSFDEAVYFIREEKYNQRYEMIWWYVSGIIYAKGNLETLLRFWQEIENHPRDLIEIKHINLVIGCLEECKADDSIDIHIKLLTQIEQWLTYSLKYKASESYSTDCELYSLNFSPHVANKMEKVLIMALKNPDDKLRSAAVNIFAKFDQISSEVVDALTEALSDSNLRHYAIRALSRIKSYAGGDVRTECYSLDSFSRVTPAVLKGLVKVLKAGDGYTQQIALDVLDKLEKITPEVQDTLMQMLDSREHCCVGFSRVSVKVYVAAILVRNQQVTDKVLSILMEELENGNRKFAAESLSKIEDLPQEAIERLTQMLKHQNSDTKVFAAKVLLQFKQASAATEALVQVLRDRHCDKENAIAVMYELPELPSDAIQALVGLLKDERSGRSCAKALLKFEHSVPEAMVVLLQRSHVDFSKPIVKIESHDYAIAEVLALMMKALSSYDRETKKSAIEILGNFNQATLEITTALIQILKSPLRADRNLKEVAINSLIKLGQVTPKVITVLMQALSDSDTHLKEYMIQALSHLELVNPQAIAAFSDDMIKIFLSKKKGFFKGSLQCYSLSSNPAWLDEILARGLREKAYFILRNGVLQVITAGSSEDIKISKSQIIKMLEIVKAQEFPIDATIFIDQSSFYKVSKPIKPKEAQLEKHTDTEISRELVIAEPQSLSVHSELMKKLQAEIGLSLEEIYNDIMINMAGLRVSQKGTRFIANEKGSTEFYLRFASKVELWKFLAYYEERFPGFIKSTNPIYSPDQLTCIEMDTKILYENVAVTLGEYKKASESQPVLACRFFRVEYSNPILNDQNILELFKQAKVFGIEGINKLISCGDNYNGFQGLRRSFGDKEAVELLLSAYKLGSDGLLGLLLDLGRDVDITQEVFTLMRAQGRATVLHRLLGVEDSQSIVLSTLKPQASMLSNFLSEFVNKGWVSQYLKSWLCYSEIKQLKGILEQYSIDMAVQDALSSKGFRQVSLKLHPDKGGSNKDFAFVRELKAKFDGELDIKALVGSKVQELQPKIYQLSIGFKLVDTAVDGIRLYYAPTLKNLNAAVVDTVQVSGMLFMFNKLSLGASLLSVGYTYYAEGGNKAVEQGIASLAYTALPYMLIYADLSYVSFIYGAGMAIYSAYHAINNAYSLYNEYLSQENELRSATAYKDMFKWASASSNLHWFKEKTLEYNIKINSIKLHLEQKYYEEKSAEKGEFGQKLYQHIYGPYLEEKYSLLGKVVLGELTPEEMDTHSSGKLVVFEGLGYDLCRLDHIDIAVYYHCYDEAKELLQHIAVISGNMIEVIEDL